jgi:hypothetical protein
MLEQGAWFAPEGAKQNDRTKKNGRNFGVQYFDTISQNFDSLPVFGNPNEVWFLITVPGAC